MITAAFVSSIEAFANAVAQNARVHSISALQPAAAYKGNEMLV
jgi:hypothetical protein